MENCFAMEYLVLPEDVDASGYLKLSRLLSLLENISSVHSADMGIGREVLSPHNWGWIVISYQLNLGILPQMGETISVRTQAGESRHGLYDRRYEIAAQDGHMAVSGWGCWSVFDLQKRCIVLPTESGIEHPPTELKFRFFPWRHRQFTPCGSFSFPVLEEYIDGNGHMNNARYAETAMAHLTFLHESPAHFQIEYRAEAKLGETIHVDWGQDDDTIFLQGMRKKDICFLMKLQFEHSPIRH